MKLYEFNLSDNLNLHESKILEYAKASLEEEARIQGWKPGYTFDQCKKFERLPSGELLYTFVVQGEFVEGQGQGEAADRDAAASKSTGTAARSPEAEL